MSKPGIPYSEIRDQLQTCDLMLFRGSDFVSNFISQVEKFENSCGDFTHTGICIRAESFYYPDPTTRPSWWTPGKIYVLESTISGYKYISDGVPDVEGKNALCVQLRDLDEVVNHYDTNPNTRLAWSPMLDQFRPININQPSPSLQETYDRYRGLYYDASFVDLSAAAIPFMRHIRDNKVFRKVRDTIGAFCFGTQRSDSTDNVDQLPDDNVISNWQFCSEVIAHIYVDLGILPSDVIPDNVIPTDYLPNSTDPTITNDTDHQVPLIFKPYVRYHM